MLLTLDMGNTNITIGVFDGERLMLESRVATDLTKMEDQYAIDLMDIFRLYQINARDFEGAILSSVVPPLEHAVRGAVKKVTGMTPLMVGPGMKTGVNIRIDNPAQLGPDLLVGAVAAVAKFGAPASSGISAPPPPFRWWIKPAPFSGGAIMPALPPPWNPSFPAPPFSPASAWRRPPRPSARTASRVCSRARCMATPP